MIRAMRAILAAETPADTVQTSKSISAARPARLSAGTINSMAISDRVFVIGEASEMREVEPAENERKGLQMKNDKLTKEQMLEARLNSFERRIEQLEGWTGADEDGNWSGDDVSVVEQLVAQDAIIAHLLRYLELLVPGFSIAQFRRDMHLINRGANKRWLEQNPDRDPSPQEFIERSERIIDAHLPASLYDDGGRPTGPFPEDFLSLVRARTSVSPADREDS